MYAALKNDYPSFQPPLENGGLLTPWAEQGVLMLNTCLTVRAHEANSHSNRGWEKFTQKVIDTVAKVRGRGVVFLAWGSPAAKRVVKVNKTKHLVLQSVHPSPLSAHKGFLTCGHFKKTNNWLAERYGQDGIINWDLRKQRPIAPQGTTAPVKATEMGTKPEEVDGRTKSLLETKLMTTASSKDNFDGDEDEDAIEALEAMANSSMNGDGEIEPFMEKRDLASDVDAEEALEGIEAPVDHIEKGNKSKH